MKILLVDDDAFVRLGMRAGIPWEEHGYQVVGEAVNGLEALKLAKEYLPDIVLVDIVMPEMNGIDFINEIREEQPFCKFIILSCMNDIEYYRKAMSLGVSEYLLKSSFKPDEILEVVKKVANDIRKERVFDRNDPGKEHVNNYLVVTEFLNMLLKKRISDPLLIRDKFLSFGITDACKEYYVITVSPCMINEEEYDEALDSSVISLCQEIINGICKGFIFKNNNDIITAIVWIPDDYCKSSFIADLCHRMQKTISQSMDIALTIGISECSNDCGKIYDLYGHSLNALHQSFYSGSGHNYFFGDDNISNYLSDLEYEKNTIFEIDSLSEVNTIYGKMKSLLEKYFERRKTDPKLVKKIYIEVMYYIISLLRREKIEIKEIFGFSLDVASHVEECGNMAELDKGLHDFINNIYSYYLDMLYEMQEDIIYNIRQYVDANIGTKITLNGLSKEIHLSTAYICRIYKQKTGENLSKYIAAKKVEKAIELLPVLNDISRVTEALGFSSESYFIKTFKAFTGMTPKQYLKQAKGKIV